MGVTVVKINDTEQESLIEKFSLAEQILFENREKDFGTSTFLDLMLSSNQL